MTLRREVALLRPRRAVLSVPATSERMLSKAAGLTVDEVVIDFEDSVVAEQKTDVLRGRVAERIADLSWNTPRLALRVNAHASEWFRRDIEVFAGCLGGLLDSVVIPKVESPDELLAARAALDAAGSVCRLQALIESARGLVAVETIAAAAEATGLVSLIFGPGDYAASLGVLEPVLGGIDPRFPGDQWQYARSRIANAAHAFELDAVDGPYALFDNEKTLNESATRARLLGFSGKWVIHPRQIRTVTTVFTPSDIEVAHARQIIAALERARSDGSGAVTSGDAMVDAASLRQARRIVAQLPEEAKDIRAHE
jgi:citrate lyase subunit beta/citryl-CoA lyase